MSDSKMISVSRKILCNFSYPVCVCFTSGGKKKVVATIDVRDGKLNQHDDSFEWEGNIANVIFIMSLKVVLLLFSPCDQCVIIQMKAT